MQIQMQLGIGQALDFMQDIVFIATLYIFQIIAASSKARRMIHMGGIILCRIPASTQSHQD